MNLIHIRRIAAIVGMTAASVTTFSAGAETFLNGESFYGQPSRGGTGSRVVDLGTTKYINVAYGETVTFRSQGREFSWTFNGLDSYRAVDVRKVAPAGFTAAPLTVYVAPDPHNRS